MKIICGFCNLGAIGRRSQECKSSDLDNSVEGVSAFMLPDLILKRDLRNTLTV